jgi:hypothetical protein
MTKIWWAKAPGSFFIGIPTGVAGYLPWWSPSDFTQNILAEVFGLCIAFGLAIMLIEGQILTQRTRRRKIVTKKLTLEFRRRSVSKTRGFLILVPAYLKYPVKQIALVCVKTYLKIKVLYFDTRIEF